MKSSLSIEEAYRPPTASVNPGNRIPVRFRPQRQLTIINLTDSKSLLQKSFSTDNDLRFSGRFDLEIRIKLGSLIVGQHRISARKLFKSSSLTRYTVTLYDEHASKEMELQIEHYLPSFYPFIPTGIRLTLDGQIVFEQGKVPDTIWSLV